MEQNTLAVLAASLYDAAKTLHPIAPLTATHPDMTLEDAYAVQLLNVAEKVKAGAKIIGKKVGLTSRAMQHALGVNEPDYGHLFSDTVYAEGEPLSLAALLQPKIEAELAFIMAEDLTGPGVTIADVLRCTAAVTPAFEVIGSRIRNWEITLLDTVADNASGQGLLLGSKLTPVSAVNLKYVGMVLEKNGQVLATAAGAEIMGHPANTVAWLANTLGKLGVSLKRGEIVLSGSFTQAFPATAGDVFTATFGELGSVTISFCA